jgi:sulfur relay (sulfurtransferase) complex TusBCD TusD component (DsrE family)
MSGSYFLFCDMISDERINWLRECIEKRMPDAAPQADDDVSDSPGCTIFLTGESLMSLADRRMIPGWRSLLKNPRLNIVADGDELNLHGLVSAVREWYPKIIITEQVRIGDSSAFWNSVLSMLIHEWEESEKAAFLLCNSPYMSRIPVYMLRFLNCVAERGLSPEFYAYLDGVHSAHMEQSPSEFENVGDGISKIFGLQEQSGSRPWFSACSRCATARGYYIRNRETGGCEPSSCIDSITIRPLKEILDRFSSTHPILSHACGGSCQKRQPDEESSGAAPELLIFLTNSPYSTEWTFGGISLAVAAAMGGIWTSVVFIEQGIYSLCGEHEISPGDRVFNIQEMIMATTDIPELAYFVYSPSLVDRGIEVSENLSMVDKIDSAGLGDLIWRNIGEGVIPRSRTIFF